MIRQFLMFTAVVFFAQSAMAEEQVYRDVQEDGIPSFSDHATPGAEEIEIEEPVTFSHDEFVPDNTYRDRPSQAGDEPTVSYTARITSPENDAAVRDNAGNLTIQVSISPTLGPGVSATLLMNGSPVRTLQGSGSVSLTNIDRGTHVFTVSIEDQQGNVLTTSSPTTVSVLRYAAPRPRPRS